MTVGIGNNKIFKYISAIVLILIILFIFFINSNKENNFKPLRAETKVEISKEDRDNYVDTVQSLNAKFKSISEKQNEAIETIEKLKKENLKIKSKLNELNLTDSENLKTVVSEFDKYINDNKKENQTPDSIKLNYPVSEEKNNKKKSKWIEPVEESIFSGIVEKDDNLESKKIENKQGAIDKLLDTVSIADDAFYEAVTDKKQINNSSDSVKKLLNIDENKIKNKKVFTIPKNATIFKSYLATSLIGRIPSSNNLNNPYRFKILTGANAISSNGIKLPKELASMTFSGTASGDWGLSCARGKIDSVTFTFNDGEIVTKDSQSSLGLGWISDEFGNPCLRGEKVSNSSGILAKRMLAGAFTSTADAYSRAQVDTQFAGNGVVVGINDASKYATYNAISGAAKQLEGHLDKRLNTIFDAIYVPNGEVVMIHIEKAIEIDRNNKNRRVSYEEEVYTINDLD